MNRAIDSILHKSSSDNFYADGDNFGLFDTIAESVVDDIPPGIVESIVEAGDDISGLVDPNAESVVDDISDGLVDPNAEASNGNPRAANDDIMDLPVMIVTGENNYINITDDHQLDNYNGHFAEESFVIEYEHAPGKSI